MAYNILIVDDSAIIRTAIERTLRIAGLDVGEVHQAENGKKALEALEEHWIDIVFADINMPEMNGIEMVDAMLQRGLMKTIPVVIITTERSEVHIEQLKARGISAFMNKPFTPEAIRDVVLGILK
jgi:two-component system, chemotaxis family, chemotaxis protein CheY